jgi:hypothetical protein
MARKASVEQIQNLALLNFERAIQSEEWRTDSEPTQIEQIKERSARKREEWSKKFTPQPFISLYNPASPLNGFSSKTKDEQQAITKRLKAESKQAAKQQTLKTK